MSVLNVLFFAFPQYADFEVAHTLFFLRKLGKAQITTFSVDGKPVESVAGLTTIANASAKEMDVRKFDLVLLPGGDGVQEVLDNSTLQDLLKQAYSLHIPIASICASATFLSKAGLLEGKEFTCQPGTFEHFRELFEGAHYIGSEVEIGKGFITAKGTAFPQFTLEVCKLAGLIKDSKHAESILTFCKGSA